MECINEMWSPCVGQVEIVYGGTENLNVVVVVVVVVVGVLVVTRFLTGPDLL